MLDRSNLGSIRKAIVLSPPGNPAAFPEVRDFVNSALEIFDWRFEESHLDSVHDIVADYRYEVPNQVLNHVDSERFDALLIACTGMSYQYTPAEDRKYWEKLEELSGIQVATATRTVEELWKENHHDSMILVSPYDDKATFQAEEYWTQMGFRVRQVLRVESEHPYQVSEKDIEQAVGHTRLESGVPILFSGTGMLTKDSLIWARQLHDAPVYSVNLAGAQWLQKVTS